MARKKKVSTIDVRELATNLSERVEDVCKWLLPNGISRGGEWEVGSVDGEPGHSCKVSLHRKPGLWKDFAGEDGGDLIDLIRAVKGVSLQEAISEAKSFLGIEVEPPTFAKKKEEYRKPSAEDMRCTKPNQEILDIFKKRKISQETITAFKVGYKNLKGEDCMVFPYLQDGIVKHIKFRRTKAKKFSTSYGTPPILFGWHLVDPNARALVLCEGEIDAMTFYEQGMCALSIPFGGGGKGNQDSWIATEWDRLECFDTIYLALDNDETGHEGMQQIIARLGRHRCFIVDFGKYKDANEAHMAGESLWKIVERGSKSCEPDDLRSACDFNDELLDFVQNGDRLVGAPLPWVKTHNWYRMRYGEVTIWGGINGHGKTQVLNHISVYSMSQGHNWCVASMEMQPKKLLARMSRQYLGRKKITEQEIRGTVYKSHQNLWLYNVLGTANVDSIIDTFMYAFKRYDCRFFVVDSLSKCGIDEDDYPQQKKAIERFVEFAMSMNVHVHVVTHVRKDIDEYQIPGKFSIKGTGAITDMVDNVFVVWRNKPLEESKRNPDSAKKVQSNYGCILNLCKQRHHDWEGKIGLFYDIHSSQYLENENDRTIDYSTGELNNGTMPNGDQIPF